MPVLTGVAVSSRTRRSVGLSPAVTRSIALRNHMPPAAEAVRLVDHDEIGALVRAGVEVGAQALDRKDVARPVEAVLVERAASTSPRATWGSRAARACRGPGVGSAARTGSGG